MKIQVIKSAKPSTFCQWMVDEVPLSKMNAKPSAFCQWMVDEVPLSKK
jgi:hypothetical protein